MFAATTAFAGEIPQPAILSEEAIKSYAPENTRIEARLDADITGDGMRDLAFIAANAETRVLKVLKSYSDEFSIEFESVGEVKLDISPLADGQLKAEKGILIVEDLTGGTTAIQSKYRYRFDPKAKRMQLIGDDLTLYSRTYAHDGYTVSTNRLTGLQIGKEMLLKDGGYVDQPEKKKKISAKALYMEDTPNPEDTLNVAK